MKERAAVNLRKHAPLLLLSATSAGLAYLIAAFAFGEEGAFFAPIAAVICTGLTVGQRRRRAAEIALGVLLGGAAADVLVRVAGAGAWQLAVAVLVAVTIAVAIRPSGLLVNQAAVAAVVVIAVGPILDVSPWIRLADAVIGGCVALLLTAIYPGNPVNGVLDSARNYVTRHAAIVNEAAAAIDHQSLSRADQAIEQLGELKEATSALDDSVSATRERLAGVGLLQRRGQRESTRHVLARAESLVMSADATSATCRGMCRAASNAVRHPRAIDDVELSSALFRLARVICLIPDWVAGALPASELRADALKAAVKASVRDEKAGPRHTRTVLIMQIRSAVVDLLQLTGLPRPEAVSQLEAAAGETDELIL
ncbi:FUSC family protein [Hoyosella subflava]|uniref:Membrane protein-like protein n=1 Tax=Hoyosella subflava (strain DSM 45089 / JCM 17490 / NBRC 109087 / DQS3-9A1) TaxID=443218 RepID=F6EGD5_HOYSD|nr:FUSC family protein [Hoyosella subflava]AEF39860.1 Membrane protein-like protein [Hoyosella subflava DQS3-9A1]